MIIKKILNNNVVVVMDENDNEIIVMGKGLAFQKKSGDEIDETRINKVFTIINADISKQFQELIASIPVKYMRVTSEIIDYAKKQLGRKLSDSIYVSLTDHIYSAIERFMSGITLKNRLLWDIKRLYTKEYAIGMTALDIIYKEFNVKLPEDEAGFITFHFVTSQLENDIPSVYDLTKIIRDITNIVQYYFHIQIDKDSLLYNRFVTHLKFFSQRLLNGSENQIEGVFNDHFSKLLCEQYTEYIPCIEKIEQYIFERFNFKISKYEKMYLMIHIVNIVNKLS
ncbi:BglG family transcription antiterminator LicT [Clostridium sp. DJ247]|uniref:BglG family transcription antiterminator LicT n=1 Tax=Clostridium sp. DJ247 TaxID=2726188 RepID=UPI00162940C9|nr:PRD domain-containing protein [Clostridium sp. DJ247]MBC2579199.1 PRD domain-containing protein [Clostridium sp. DJ247]